MARFVYGHLAEAGADERWRLWASRLSLTVAVEAIMIWLDAGSPDPDEAPRRIDQVVQAVITAIGDD
ncbi:hypothetical protein [Glycomyces tenuis]|uniref:hypothetical protein n=1 Tax=Glycomyces tenuis TaxID=58116 RepID=UPI0004058CC4|nr:hypothetical protein [Glycomyces tenuis]